MLHFVWISRIFRYLWTVIPLLFVTIYAMGQDRTFDQRYKELYHQVYTAGTDGVIAAADSLYDISANDEERMKSRMLLGVIYHGLGDIAEALFQVTKAQEIAEKGGYKEWEARTTGFLANIYRVIGLSEEAKKGFEKAERLNERQKDEPAYYLTKANILQERAQIAIREENPVLALDFLQEASDYIDLDRHNAERAQLVKGINLQNQAVCYLLLDKPDRADSIFQQANFALANPNSMVLPYVYRGRAESALHTRQYDSAYHYLQLIEPFVNSSQDLEILLYNTYAKYYRALEDNEQAMRYMSKGQEVVRLRRESADRVIHEFIRKLERDNQSYRAEMAVIWKILPGVVVLLGFGMVFLFIKRRKEKRAYFHIIEHLEAGKELPIPVVHAVSTDAGEVEKNAKGPLMSKETEARLLEGLERLEDRAFFLDKEMSLVALALQLGTNQRYASHIVSKHSGVDFNIYLQHRRIHYFMDRIRQEPDLLDCKLSYLADLAGFPSHSKFSAVFKSVTGIPPSVFIHYTKEEDLKKS